jgi:hypothetical protein
LLPLLVVVGVVCWIVLPTAVLVAAAVGSRRQHVNPVWVRRCRGSSEGGEVCWVPAEAEYCPRHEAFRPRAQDLPGRPGQEIFIA